MIIVFAVASAQTMRVSLTPDMAEIYCHVSDASRRSVSFSAEAAIFGSSLLRPATDEIHLI
jgi:hypothetical protein